MADGNFNRSPLSTNKYQSGVRAGKANMRTIATNALEAVLKKRFPALSEEELLQIKNEFKEMITQ
jgi:hypothetical protein